MNKRVTPTVNDEGKIEFPCEFPIKVMGRDSTKFRAIARALVEKHTGPIEDRAIREASSRNGTFISITITIDALSQQQLDDIYTDISEHDEVLMAL